MALEPPSHDLVKWCLYYVKGLPGVEADETPGEIHIAPLEREDFGNGLARCHGNQEHPVRLILDDGNLLTKMLWAW